MVAEGGREGHHATVLFRGCGFHDIGSSPNLMLKGREVMSRMCGFEAMAGTSGTHAVAMAVIENIHMGVKASGRGSRTAAAVNSGRNRAGAKESIIDSHHDEAMASVVSNCVVRALFNCVHPAEEERRVQSASPGVESWWIGRLPNW